MAMELFTAQKILELAFGAIVETGVGKLTEGAIVKGQQQLWKLIRNRLQGKPDAKAAIVKVEQNHSKESLQQLIPFLEAEMNDGAFAQEIQNLAQQVNLGSQENIVMNVDTRDNAPVVGKAEAQTQNIGGNHTHNYYDSEKKT